MRECYPGHTISGVDVHGVAHELGIVPGDRLLSISGQRVLDVIDYIALGSEPELTLLVEKRDGAHVEYHIQKDEMETLGLTFDNDLMDRRRTCANDCVFCFISQMPKGMRESLYLKDDDWRLSMMMGNYVTLTNVSEATFARMLRRRVSPLYISVHATDGDIRARMMRNPNAGDIMQRLRMLAEAGCVMHGQVVFCPGYNGGATLSRTLWDLYGLYPAMRSVAVVPVGLTRYREGLPFIKPVDRRDAMNAIARVRAVAGRALKENDTRFVFASDEMYLLAGQAIPEAAAYEDYPQIENGVGLISKLTEEFHAALREAPGDLRADYRPCVATGVLAAPVISALLEAYTARTGVEVPVYAVPNRFFGEGVTVAGLVTGRDLIGALSGQPRGGAVLIPRCMLSEQGGVFLDGLSVQAVSEALGTPVVPVPVEGEGLLRALQGYFEEEN